MLTWTSYGHGLNALNVMAVATCNYTMYEIRLNFDNYFHTHTRTHTKIALPSLGYCIEIYSRGGAIEMQTKQLSPPLDISTSHSKDPGWKRRNLSHDPS